MILYLIIQGFALEPPLFLHLPRELWEGGQYTTSTKLQPSVYIYFLRETLKGYPSSGNGHCQMTTLSVTICFPSKTEEKKNTGF